MLLVTVDTLRADRIGAYGHAEAETPTFDGLADRGTLFLRALTPMPRTTPGLASLLSGLSPQRHGSREVGQPIEGADRLTLLPELLGAHGYATLAVVANASAGPGQGLDRGFDVFVPAQELDARRAEDVTERALKLVDDVPPAAPLFLWVHYIDPHAPYDPPPPWGSGPRGEPCRDLSRRAEEEGWEAGDFFSDRGGISSRALPSCSWLYDAEVAYTDRQVGRLLAGLDERRDLHETVVVFTADHGENLGEQGLYFQHGPSLHDASLRVPLVVAGPGIPGGRVDDTLVALQDVLPLLLRIVALPVPDDLDGVDPWKPWWARGQERTVVTAEAASALMAHNTRYLYSGRAGGLHCFNGPRFSLCQAPGEDTALFDRSRDRDLREDVSDRFPQARERLLSVAATWSPEEVRERAVSDSRFKLVERPLPMGGYRRFLFDLEVDPAEESNVASIRPEVLERLEPFLVELAASLPEPHPPERSPEEIDALKALGYLR